MIVIIIVTMIIEKWFLENEKYIKWIYYTNLWNSVLKRKKIEVMNLLRKKFKISKRFMNET